MIVSVAFISVATCPAPLDAEAYSNCFVLDMKLSKLLKFDILGCRSDFVMMRHDIMTDDKTGYPYCIVWKSSLPLNVC